LFIDGRKLGALIPGSRKQKQLAEEEIEKIAAVYREFKNTGDPAEVPGFCKVATLDEVKEHRYALTPGRYVGAAEGDDEDEAFEERWPRLVEQLRIEFERGAESQKLIESALQRISHGS
jgi:type I restriction enzyme M protein